MKNKLDITNKAIILFMLCFILAGADTFMYSNPIVKKANIYYKNKKFKKSLQLYLKAEKKLEDKKMISFNLANAYYKTNDFDSAIKHFESSLRDNDDTFNAKIMFNIGNSYFKKST
ncbi:tetratricopeptide repeat protein [Thermodesulfobacteriota bacterium]